MPQKTLIFIKNFVETSNQIWRDCGLRATCETGSPQTDTKAQQHLLLQSV